MTKQKPLTNEEILRKAIEKAVKNGWKPIKLKENEMLDRIETSQWDAIFYTRKKYSRKPKNGYDMEIGKRLELNNIIFSHDFAEAFWGEEPAQLQFEGNDKKNYGGISPIRPAWQCHLQQMVLEPEPLKYLAKFL